MKLDSQGSQFTSVGSQRLKHVPDVLFVDEDGNPIEAGHENLIYVDEQGNEIPEEIAQQLLESGKYIDSRDLYLAADATTAATSASSTTAVGDTTNTTGSNHVSGSGGSGGQYDLTQPSLPASAFGSLSKSTGANEFMAAMMTRKSSYQSLKSAGGGEESGYVQTNTQQARMKQREDELREIEADASAIQQHPNKSMSNTDMQKSHSGRRLLQPPPLKNSQDFKSQDSMARRQTQQQQAERPSSNQQVFELHQLINSTSSKTVGDHQSGIDGDQTSRDAASTERVRSRQGRSSRKSRQQIEQQYTDDGGGGDSGGGGSYYEVGGAMTDGGETGDDVQSQLTEQHILEMREQQMLREKLLRKQQEYLREQQEYAAARRQQQQQQQHIYEIDPNSQDVANDETTMMVGDDITNATTTAAAAAEQEEAEYLRQLSRNFTQSVGSTNLMSPPARQPVGSHHHGHHINNNSSSSAAIVSTTAGSHMTPVSLTYATRDRLKEYLKDFHVEYVRHVGSLSGRNVIYNLGKIDLSEFDRFYTNIIGDDTFTCSSRVGVGQCPYSASGVGSRASNLGLTDEIDPYDPNLFKDEIIDIDFGAIDAYTAGLNAQINAEKTNGQQQQQSSQLQFPSHILTSNHATFIDNQMLLGDPFYSQAGANNSTTTATTSNFAHESTSNLNGNNNTNGMNVQFFSSVNDLQQQQQQGSVGDAGFVDLNTQSQLNSQGGASGAGISSGAGGCIVDTDDVNTGVNGGSGGQYSPSNSFGSMVDIQSQQTYSIGDMNQLSQLQQQQQQHAANRSNITTTTTSTNNNHQVYHSASYQPTSSHNYYSGSGSGACDGVPVDYANQYQQTSNSVANIGGGATSKMRNSFTNSSAIYNVNNYISR